MAKTPSIRRKPLVVLAIFLVSWWVLPVAFKLSLRDAFQSFQAPIWDFSSRAADLGEFWSHRARSHEQLISAGRDQARLASGEEVFAINNSLLPEERQRLLILTEEVSLIRKDLGMADPPEFKPLVTRITKRELNTWWQRIHLRKGEQDGIRKGDGVIFGGGVVGRIIETSTRASIVQLATSPYFRIAANFRGDDRPITFQGGGNQSFSSPFGTARDAPTDISPTSDSPQDLVTSPLSETFPAGIKIGQVPNLKTDPNGLFRTGRVEMDARLLTLREVTVLVPLERGTDQ